MAHYYTPELDDVHRWLPPEILADVGVTRTPPSADAAARRRLAVIEDLTAHLAGLLGRASMAHPPPPPPAMAASYHHHHHPQVCGFDGRVLVANGGRGRSAVTPPFLPAPAVRWQVGEGFGSGRVLHPPVMRRPRFAPAKRRGGGGGTGVFLPRAEVYQSRAAKSPGNDVRLSMGWQQKQQGGEEEATGKHELHAMASEIEQQQQQNTSAALHACPELLALPQEWTY